MARRLSIAERIHRALLRLLPGEFRGDFGDAMRADFDDRRAGEGDARAIRREALPLVSTAISEHAGILRRDIRDALRTMRRAPGFTALAILMLALGTGVNVAMFSVIDAVMLRSPFVDRGRMAYVSVVEDAASPSAEAAAAGPIARRWTTIMPTDRFLAFEAAPGAFEAVGGLGFGDHRVTRPGEPRRPRFDCVTAGMFGVVGTAPQYGRVFGPDDDRPGASPTVVLSDQFARELGDHAALVGTTITINETAVTVVGVMPRGFDGIASNRDHGWLPARVALKGGGLDGCSVAANLQMFVRVRKGLTLADAVAATPGVQLTPVDELTYGNRRTSLLILASAVACVLLIACFNVGGLQLERAVARRREVALRAALGASRARLIRHALTEHVLLALAGAAAAIVATRMLQGALVSVLPPLSHVDEIAINGRAMLAAVVIAAVAGLMAGLIPVVHIHVAAPAGELAASGRAATMRHDWTRRGLVVTQIALSIVVLIAAGLMIRTFAALRPTQPGFNSQQQLFGFVELPTAAAATEAGGFARIISGLREVPGVRDVAATSYIPMSGTFSSVGLVSDGGRVSAYGSAVTAGYFEQMQIPVRSGRSFADTDTAVAPRVVVINEALAARLRPNGVAIGLRVRARAPLASRATRTRVPESVEWQIIGVVGNTRAVGRDLDARPEIYMPFAQAPQSAAFLIMLTERWRDPAVPAEFRGAIRAAQADAVVEPIESLTGYLERRVATPRFGAWLLGVFATLAATLAAIGLMTTMGWWVRQRTRELGVRVALGASRAQVLKLVLRQGLVIAVSGIVAGLLFAAGLTRYLEGWIYGVSPLDPATFAAMAAAMLAISIAAVYLPARRALLVDPVIALRSE